MQRQSTFIAEPGEQDLERASRLIVAGELVAAVAHDLRQPLTATEMNISAALRLASRFVDAQSSPATIATVAELDAALRDALLEQGRMRAVLQMLEDIVQHREPVCESVDPVALVQEVAHLMVSEVSARHMTIDLTVSSTIPRIVADVMLVRQALLNIILDALDRTSASRHPGGPITITVDAREPGLVDIVVTHFGAAFESAADSKRGLALARSIAEVHGAVLTVDGNPESGIAVTTRWPIRRESVELAAD